MKVSIIVPVYNVEKYINRCLNSIVNQTLKDIEIIVVNDETPDNSQDIIDKYVLKDKRVKSYIKKNGGLSDARNYGLKRATGKYILFVDSDDYIEPNSCEVLYKTAENNSLDVLVANYNELDEDVISVNKNTVDEKVCDGNDFIKKYFSQKNVSIMAWLLFCNRNYLIKNNFYFKKGIYHEDEQLVPRIMLKAKKIQYIDFNFYNYIRTFGSITKKKDKTKNIRDIYSICDELEEIYMKIEDKKTKKLLIDRLVYIRLLAFGMQNSLNSEFIFEKNKIKNKAYKLKNKVKSLLYLISPKIYFKILKVKYRDK